MEGVNLSEHLALRLQDMEFRDRTTPRKTIKRQQEYRPPTSTVKPVRIYHGVTAGTAVQANSSGLHPGRLRKWYTGAGQDYDPNVNIWIAIVDVAGDPASIEGAEFIGLQVGRATHEGDDRPLYAVQRGTTHFKSLIQFTLDEELTTGDLNCAATIDEQWGPGIANPNTSITLINPDDYYGFYQYSGAAGIFGRAIHHEGQYYVIVDLNCTP